MCRHSGCPSPSDPKNACVTCGGWFCSPEHLAEHVNYYRIMTISKAQVKDVERVLADNSLDATVRQYSGRGMYDKQCLGITVGDCTSPFELGLAIGSDDELVDLFAGQRVETDSMGRGMVIYFPDLKWVVGPDTLVDSSTPPVV